MTDIIINVSDLAGNKIEFDIDDSITLSELYKQVQKNTGVASNDDTSDTYDFLLQEFESLPDNSCPSGQLNQVSRDFIYILSKKDNGINYEKGLVDLSIPIGGESYIGVNLPTYRNIEEAIVQEKKEIVINRNMILHAVGLSVLSAGLFSGIPPLSREIGGLNAQQEKEANEIRDSKCLYDLDLINFDWWAGPDIGSQENMTAWNNCMSDARSMKPEYVCGITYWDWDHDKRSDCSQYDLDEWCRNKGLYHPTFIVSNQQYDLCVLKFEASQRKKSNENEAMGVGIIASILALVGLYSFYRSVKLLQGVNYPLLAKSAQEAAVKSVQASAALCFRQNDHPDSSSIIPVTDLDNPLLINGV